MCVYLCMYVCMQSCKHVRVMCYVYIHGLHIREFLTLACRGLRGFPRLLALKLVQGGLCIGAQYLWDLSMEFASFHPSASYNFEVAPTFLKNL